MHGKKSDSSVTVQVVHLSVVGNELEMELSDKITKTRASKVVIPNPQSISLYSVIKIKYEVMPINRMETDIPER